jgi:hypothetical protein
MRINHVLSLAVVIAVVALSACTKPAAVEESELIAEEAEPELVLTIEEVNAAQQRWCEALVEIGRLSSTGGDYKGFAEEVLTNAYDYDNGRVFFKPTLTSGDQVFRKTKQGALAYFVGGDPKFPDDTGFALKPWVKCWHDNLSKGAEEVMVYGNIGISMGNVHFADKDGNEIHVDKTFVFKKTDDGKVRLIVHKSALPYNP